MGKEYKAKVFKSGNSLALRLPKSLGLAEGATMILREDRGKFAFEPAPPEDRRIDLTGIYGSVKGLKRLPFQERKRPWNEG